MMKKLFGVVALALLATGCATSSSVKSQIDPLADRLAAVEKQQASLDAKLNDVTKNEDAQNAELKAIRSDLQASNQSAQEAKQALADAKAAAERAEAAANKSTKAFELRQQKGKR